MKRMRMRAMVGLWGAAFLAASTAIAQVKSDVRILPGDLQSGPVVGLQETPAIAAGDGIFLAVWADYRATPEQGPNFATEGSGSDIFAARIDANGALLDPEPIVITDAFGDQDEPLVSWNGTHWLVVWSSQNRSYYDDQVRAVRVAPDGTVLDAPFRVAGASDSMRFDLTSNGSDWAVVYTSVHAGESSIRVTRISPAGTVLDPGGVMLFDPASLTYFAIRSAGGEYLFAWDDLQAIRLTSDLQRIGTTISVPSIDFGSNGSDYLFIWISGANVVVSEMSPAGVLDDPAGIPVDSSSGVGTYELGIGWDGTHWWPAWKDYEGFRVARVTTSGTVLDFGGVAVEDPQFASLGTEVVVAGRPGGGAQLLWKDRRALDAYPESGHGEFPQDIYAVSVDAAAVPGPTGPISLAPPTQRIADLADGPDQVLAVFRSDHSDGRRIVAQRLDSLGNPLDLEPVEIASGTYVNDPAVSWNGSVYLIVWVDSTNCDRPLRLCPVDGKIYGRRMSADGTLIDSAPVFIMDGAEPDVAGLVDTFLVVGTHYTLSILDWRIAFAMRVDGATAALLDPAPIELGWVFARVPRVIATNGRWLATWEQNVSHDDLRGHTRAVFVEADGTPGDDFSVAGGYTPDVAYSGNEILFIMRERTTSNADNNIISQRMLPDGTLPTGACFVSAETDRQVAPVITWNGTHFVTFWSDKRHSTYYFDERSEIFGARLDPATGLPVDPKGFSLGGTTRPEIEPAVTTVGGKVFVAASIMSDAPGGPVYRIAYDVLGEEAPGNVWPVALASSDTSSGSIPLAVSFGSAGSFDPDGAIVGVDWDFGDGGLATDPAPNHTFQTVDDYLVQLEVTDDAGARTNSTILVRARAVNQPPVAVASSDISSGRAPLAVVFSAAGSYEPDGTITQYSWTFGDGGIYYGGTAYHTYLQGGTFVTTLRTTDDEGAFDEATVTIDVQPPNLLPDVVLVPSVRGGPAPLTVAFDGSGSIDPDGSIVSYDWDFGDGTTSTEVSPIHTFTAPPWRTVTLTLTDNEGGTASKQVLIEVGQGTVYSLAASDWATTYGSISGGSFLNTQSQNNAYETLTEEVTNGSPSSRQSMLEHTWRLDVTSGRYQYFYVDAWHTPNAEGDDFVFEYSQDQVSWTPMVTVTKTADDSVHQVYAFGQQISGTLYIRARDLDRTAGNGAADTLYIDELHVLSEPSTGHVGRVPDGALDEPGSMLQISKLSFGNIRLTWGASCMATDFDYGVFEGPLGSFTEHVPYDCSIGGATALTVAPSEGNTYYLVVPNDQAYEGSYGVDGTGAERAPGPTRCYPAPETVGCY